MTTAAGLQTEFERCFRDRTADVDHYVVRTQLSDDPLTFVGTAPDGSAALILSDVDVRGRHGYITQGLEFIAASCADLALPGTQRQVSAAVLICKDERLVRPFAHLCAGVLGAGALRRPTWAEIDQEVKRWRALFSAPEVMEAGAALGLWGELWVLDRLAAPAEMLASWRGRRGPVDFVTAQGRLEVKTSTRPWQHDMSYEQVQDLDGTYFLSIAADEGAGGSSLAELVESIAAKLEDPAIMYRRTGEVGYSFATLQNVQKRFTPIAPPRLFPTARIPRVRHVDAGVTAIRYHVTLDPDCALAGDELDRASAIFGLRS